jgi:hypothetical protein
MLPLLVRAMAGTGGGAITVRVKVVVPVMDALSRSAAVTVMV